MASSSTADEPSLFSSTSPRLSSPTTSRSAATLRASREAFTTRRPSPEAAYLSPRFKQTGRRADGQGGRARRQGDAALADANRFERAEFGPLIQLAKSILEKDQKAFDEALAARHKYYARFYSDPEYQGFPDGLLDVRGLAMMKLARGVGLTPEFESVYLPAGLLEG